MDAGRPVCRVAPPDFAYWAALHALLTESFAYMDGRIDPLSSLHRLTPEGVRDKARGGAGAGPGRR